jgi:hypothetical protein
MYANLKCYKNKYNRKFGLGKPILLNQLNQKLEQLVAYCMDHNKMIDVSLKLTDDFEGKVIRFSNDWTVEGGQSTNILFLVNKAIDKYFSDTPEELKKKLLDNVEDSLEIESEIVQPAKKNIMELVQKWKSPGEKTEDSVQENIPLYEQPIFQDGSFKESRGFFSNKGIDSTHNKARIKQRIYYLLGYFLLTICLLIFSYFLTITAVKETVNYTLSQVKQIDPSQSTLSLPYLVTPVGEEVTPVQITSYIQMREFSILSGKVEGEKELSVLDTSGKEIATVKSNKDGQFEVQLPKIE